MLLMLVMTSFIILIFAMTTPTNTYLGNTQLKLWLKYPTMFENPFRFK